MKHILLIVLFLGGCATLSPETGAVRVIGKQHAAPTGCKDLGPLHLPGASMFTISPFGAPNDEALRLMTRDLGGDTFYYTSAFPLGGEAYKCKP